MQTLMFYRYESSRENVASYLVSWAQWPASPGHLWSLLPIDKNSQMFCKFPRVRSRFDLVHVSIRNRSVRNDVFNTSSCQSHCNHCLQQYCNINNDEAGKANHFEMKL